MSAKQRLSGNKTKLRQIFNAGVGDTSPYPKNKFCMVDERSVQKTMSPNLQAEQQHLLDTIVQIRGSGSVAPAYCWLTVSTVSKGGKTYEYARLVVEKPGSKPKISSLGRLGSERHRHWKMAIARREAIAVHPVRLLPQLPVVVPFEQSESALQSQSTELEG